MRIPGLAVKLDEEALPWRGTQHRGVDWVALHVEAGASGPRDATVLIRMQPGCGYPEHRHVDVEEVLVLRGGYRDEWGEHRAGDYVRYAAGSRHTPVALGDPALPPGPDNPSCLLYATARGGVENQPR